MAQKNKIYDAFITKDESAEYDRLAVDLFDLPYDKFDSKHPLEIWGDVDMGKQKKGVEWPDLSNVIIENDFNCSGFKITSDTVLPMSMEGLICLHSINDLGVLIGKLNKDVKAVVVRRAILNDVKNGKEPALSNALEFIRTYPTIEVLDENEKYSLRDALREYENSRTKSVSAPRLKKQEQQPEQIPQKTSQWLSGEEVMAICKNKSELCRGCDDDRLKRYIKRARSASDIIKISVQECMQNGQKIKCFHQDDIERVIQYVAVLVNEDVYRSSVKQKPQSAVSDKKSETIAKNASVKVDLLPTTEIKKYIPKSVWKSICKAANDNKALLISVLQEINKINVVPSETHGKKVFYVKDGQVQMSSFVDFKNCWRLTQSLGTLCDRQRIVWSYNIDNQLIAIGFVDEHDSKGSSDYKSLIRSKHQYKLSDFGECYEVTELIKQLQSDGRGDPSGPDSSGVSDVHKVSSMPEKSASNTDAPTSDACNPNALYSIGMRLNDVLYDLTIQQNQMIEIINVKPNTAELLKATQKLKKILERKRQLEILAQRFEQIADSARNTITSLTKNKTK